MRVRSVLIVAAATLAIALFRMAGVDLTAQAARPMALSGTVTSQEEGKMEGVVVSARRDGANFTVSVVSDAQGRYQFPRTHLQPGRYAVTIRVTGYDLTDPGPVEVTAAKAASVDLTLQKGKDPGAQLSSTEWAMSFPGTQQQRDAVAGGCTYCHTLERIARSTHTAEQWVPVLTRMQTFFLDGTAVSGDRGRGAKNDAEAVAAASKNPNSIGGLSKARVGEYLTTLNLSGGRTTWSYPLKTLPRPKGAATRVIMTQWDLPRKDTVAHDLAVDAHGNPWYNDQSRMYIGKLDAKASTFTEYPLPPLPEGRPGGVSDLEFDKDGNVWTMLTLPEGRCHFGAPAKDRKSTRLNSSH